MVFKFRPMRVPTDSLPIGDPGWIVGMTMRFQTAFGQHEYMGVKPMRDILWKLMKHEPWNFVPEDPEKPCRRADVYFEGVTGRPWKVTVQLLRAYDPELAARIESACNPGALPTEQARAPSGQFTVHDNIMNGDPPKQGTSRAYTLNRLKREDENMFERVVKGELSANAAAVQMGWRKKPTIVEQFDRLWRKASCEERDLIRNMIESP